MLKRSVTHCMCIVRMHKLGNLIPGINLNGIISAITDVLPKSTGPIDMSGVQIPLPKSVTTAVEYALKSRNSFTQTFNVVAIGQVVAKTQGSVHGICRDIAIQKSM